jgi:ParB/RepB/Spo0J family partition protein
MEVKVSEIKPNPFRRIDRYPINREKVEALKASIHETEFWDNLLGRKNSEGEIEIAYGHHRLVALKELGYDKIDISVKDLDDAKMLQIMGNENLAEWDLNTTVVNETVLAAKEYIDGELAKG